MRLAYLAHIDPSTHPGVFSKMCGQAAVWTQHGHQVRFFLLTAHAPSTGAPAWRTQAEAASDGPPVIVPDPGPIRRNKAYQALHAELAGWQPDLVYLRPPTWYPAIDRIMRRWPTVVEANTLDIEERAISASWWRRKYHSMTRRRLFGLPSAVIAVTHEIAASLRGMRDNVHVISNGIALDLYAPEPVSPAGPPRVAFLAIKQTAWHGIDHILELATFFPDWRFDLVGITLHADIPSNVRLHGLMPYSQYAPILRSCDVAVGSLALYRKSMQEACPLKVREYLAFGLPVIIGYRDTDFPDATPFLLQLPNAPNAVRDHVEAIRAFVSDWRGRRVDRAWIDHIDARKKESARLEVFATVAR